METTSHTPTGSDTTLTDPDQSIHQRNRELWETWKGIRDSDTLDPHEQQRQLDAISTRFIEVNMGLAAVIAKRFIRGASSADHTGDFMASALLGFWEAFTTWDPDKARFGTWAYQHISGRVRRQVVLLERPHLNYHESTVLVRANRTESHLASELGRLPTDAELAEACDLDLATLAAVQRDTLIQLDAPLTDGDHPYKDLVPVTGGVNEDDFEGAWLANLAAITAELDPKHLWVLLERHGLSGRDPQGLASIAQRIGIGREAVRRVNVDVETLVAHDGVVIPTPL